MQGVQTELSRKAERTQVWQKFKDKQVRHKVGQLMQVLKVVFV